MNKNDFREEIAFKIICKGDRFEFGLAEVISEEEINIIKEFNLDAEAFKRYFEKILVAIRKFEVENDRNLVKEVLNEMQSKIKFEE